MSHTPEPWEAYEGEEGYGITSVCGGYYGDIENEADARRIVACVNACAGIDTDVLEHASNFGAAGIQTIASVRKQRDELFSKLDKMEGRATRAEVQRDELLAALKLMVEAFDRSNDRLKNLETYRCAALVCARATIASVRP